MGLSLLFSLSGISAAEKKLNLLKDEIKNSFSGELNGLSLDELEAKKARSDKKLKALKDLLKVERPSIISYLNILPQAVRPGLWINELNVSNREKEKFIRIKGASCLNDEPGEKKAVNDCLGSLKSNLKAMPGISSMDLVMVSRAKDGDFDITVFEISGK